MSNIVFTYNEESALSAGLGGFINETGAYIINITEAELRRNNSPDNKSQWIEFSGETDDGRKVNYLSVYSVKKDGQPNNFGVNMINALMGCAAINQLTEKMISASKSVAPEFSGKKIGLILQKVLRTKQNGEDTYGMEIRMPFIAATRQTLQERKDGLQAETVDKILSTLKDRDGRKKQTQPANNFSHDSQDFDDQIPF